jgi:hypothetical protein
LARIPDTYRNEFTTDVHAQIAYRLAAQVMQTQRERAAKLLEDSVKLFTESGLTDRASVDAKVKFASIVQATNPAQAQILLTSALHEARRLGQNAETKDIEATIAEFAQI